MIMPGIKNKSLDKAECPDNLVSGYVRSHDVFLTAVYCDNFDITAVLS